MSASLWTCFRKTENDKDDVSHVTDEKQLVQEVTPTIEVGPGGLSFEEGMSVNTLPCLLFPLGFTVTLRRYCRRAWPSSRRHLVHTHHRWTGNRLWNLLDAVLDSEWCWFDRGVSHALGARIHSLVLWFVYLARVWDDVSAEWRGEGLPGGNLYETKVPRYGGVCCKCDPVWIYRERVHCKCVLDMSGVMSNRLWLGR